MDSKVEMLIREKHVNYFENYLDGPIFFSSYPAWRLCGNMAQVVSKYQSMIHSNGNDSLEQQSNEYVFGNI